ncbi:hypothetical protein ACJOX4_00540 [Acinetobacter baumannii]
MEKKEKIEFYFKVLSRYDQYIQLANSKASNHLTLLSSLLVAVTALMGWGLDVENIKSIEFKPLTCFLVGAYIFFLLFSFFWYKSCMKVLHPNRKNSKEIRNIIDEQQLSTIFYKDVDSYVSFDNFKEKVNKYTEEESLNDLLNQVHVMAHITNKKFDDYEKVNKWVSWVIVSSLLILLIIIVIKTGG